MEPTLHLNIRVGSSYPEQAPPLAGRVEGLPFDPSTWPSAVLPGPPGGLQAGAGRIVVSKRSASNHDFAQGTYAPIVQEMFTCNWGRM